MSRLFVALVLLAFPANSAIHAFSAPTTALSFLAPSHHSIFQSKGPSRRWKKEGFAPLYLFHEGEKDTSPATLGSSSDPTKNNLPSPPPSPKAVKTGDNTSFPIDAPSPLLLASSIVLAIASTGSIFELGGGRPNLGLALTATIAVVGVPSCFFLFYAAIQKGRAETEEDDERFYKENRRM